MGESRWCEMRLIGAEPDLTLDEMHERLRAQDIGASRSGVWRFFARHGISFKKIVHAAEQERADVAEARQRWREDQPSLDPARPLRAASARRVPVTCAHEP